MIRIVKTTDILSKTYKARILVCDIHYDNHGFYYEDAYPKIYDDTSIVDHNQLMGYIRYELWKIECNSRGL